MPKVPLTKAQRETLAEMREAIRSRNSAVDEATVDLACDILTAHVEVADRRFFHCDLGNLAQKESVADRIALTRAAYALLAGDGWVEEVHPSVATWTWTAGDGGPSY